MDFIEQEVDFNSWAIALPRFVLKTRSEFSGCLARSFSVRRSGVPAAHTAVFPLPIPFEGCFDGGGPKLSGKRLRVLAQKRIVHMLVIVLDYLYLGRFPTKQELGRQPNEPQRKVFERLYALVAASGSRLGRLPVVPGRSGAELIASLDVLEKFLSNSPWFGGGYGEPGAFVISASKKDESERVSRFPQLRPYRSLDVNRLKIVGTGRWPLSNYLESELWLPFVEPNCLRHGLEVGHLPVPVFSSENRDAYLELARKWDSLGLLDLHLPEEEETDFCRVFNTYKSSECDRQIGDRRAVNRREYHAGGPSSRLPPGFLLTNLFVARHRQCLRGSITDRRDFYHQAEVSLSRSCSNSVPFIFSQDELDGLAALEAFKRRQLERSSSRVVAGDRLGFEEVGSRGRKQFHGPLRPGFSALYQGDHLGVEFALEAHQNLLRREGLLVSGSRLEGHSALPTGNVWESLIIDDYFCISAQGRNLEKEGSQAFLHLALAREAYLKHQLPGSIEKDIVAEDLFKAAGAEVDSSQAVNQLGLALVGAPLQKRIGLAMVSLRAASLKGISRGLAAKLSGSWVSCLMFRRCMSAAVDGLFSIGNGKSAEFSDEVVSLPRRVAQELSFLSVFAVIMASDVSAPMVNKAYSTDASLDRGAIVEKSISEKTAKVMWLSGDKKGSYTMLDSAFRPWREDYDKDFDEELLSQRFGSAGGFASPEKPPAFEFDFLEVCGGAGVVGVEMSRMGFVVGPNLDISYSPHYNIKELRLLEWILFMLEEGRLGSCMLEPVCTTFSPAAHPACRSYAMPEGFDQSLEKVEHGNSLAYRCLFILWFAKVKAIPAMLENPRLSKMAWLRQWRWLVENGCHESVVASCAFGSIHRKEFRILSTGINHEELDIRCPGGHHHVPIQGRYTKKSATYVEGVARHFAMAFAKALRRKRLLEEIEAKRTGEESLLVNDVLRSKGWSLVRAWFWKKKAHINVYESSVVCSLLKQQLVERPSSRFVVIVDSLVSKGALAKGRSSALTLSPVLKQAAAIQVAGCLYPAYSYGPSKLNVSDDPSRGVPIREGSDRSLLDFLDAEEVRGEGAVGLRRFQANWLRLVVLAVCVSGSEAKEDIWAFSNGLWAPGFWSWLVFVCIGCVALTFQSHLVGFPVGSSLDFLREDSSVSDSVLSLTSRPAFHCRSVQSGFSIPLSHLGSFRWVFFAMAFSNCWIISETVIAPTGNMEEERALKRRDIHLAADRVVRPQTRENRFRLLEQFRIWLEDEQGIRWESIFDQKPLDPEVICNWLVRYGRELFAAGKSYSKYSETINAIGSTRPIVKRNLTAAWDLAFAWLQDEPHQHHPALPLSILVAVMTVCLLWGWPVEGAIFALAWNGLLRIGEVLDACRGDLILPVDSAPGQSHVLLRIREPKTRGRGARHQCARVDPTDVVQLLSEVFKHYSPGDRLWAYSAATLRRRLVQVLSSIGLQTKVINGIRPFDLGSLRPGGATHMLAVTEDASIVQRRGRWVSMQVMNIYLQEVSVATCLPRLDPAVRDRVQRLCNIYPQVLETALKHLRHKIPTSAWNLLYRHTPKEAGKVWG